MYARALCLIVGLLGAGLAVGEEEAKELSGISLIGNDEAPKSLYIVPWKSSEMGGEQGLSANLMDDGTDPVDKEVFMRQLEFYEISSRDGL
ncbi:hypothetical protein HUS23_12785 [Ectothiorhodospiraceae bacterium 2226]|nr:hypothetical protein HUS23_12785 [Ectothiorhodospiraceae bacterium 2226]